jgi:hypothetical protein
MNVFSSQLRHWLLLPLAVGSMAHGQQSGFINFSVRASAQANTPLIVGFNMSAGKYLLVRAVGPSLGQFGVENAMTDPKLDLYNGVLRVVGNDNFSPTDAAEFASVGAFALGAGSKDAALFTTLPRGTYTAQVSGGAGVALVELYDVSRGNAGVLSNISSLAHVGAGDSSIIPGFTLVSASPTRQVLIRAVGPGLSTVGGPVDALVDPRIELFAGGVKLAENDDWGTPIGSDAAARATLAAAMQRVGAFALANGSRDAALLVSLPSGVYTVRVSGAAGEAGPALVEVYDVAANAPATVEIDSFTITSRLTYFGGRADYVYRPLIQLRETGGTNSATVTSVAFHLDGIGASGNVPPWRVSKTIDAGSSLRLINPDVSGDYEIELSSSNEVDTVSVVITYRDIANREATVSGTAAVTRLLP